jgi:proteasome lid subunit RPN8/RPN11
MPAPSTPTSVAPPSTQRTFGIVGDIDVDIYIESAALKGAVEHARTQLTRMVLGVLLGESCTWNCRDYVKIVRFIPALKAESRAASAKFTQEAWEDIGAIRERDCPGVPLAGWMQSHPGFGLFMSGVSINTHKQFFDHPWNVQLTVDPVADTLGFFGWHKGEIRKTGFRTFVSAR